MGHKNRPFYRLRAADSRFAAQGRFIEELGWVDPLIPEVTKQAVLSKDRIEHWITQGARATETVRTLLKKQGIKAGNARK
jgi:small subunit ribosomal protein S16